MYEVQQQNAERLCQYINEEMLNGTGEEFIVLDILDALASVGLTLVDDSVGESTLAYQDLLRPPTDS